MEQKVKCPYCGAETTVEIENPEDDLLTIHILDWTGHKTLCSMDVLPAFYPELCAQDLGAVTCPYCKHQFDYIKSLHYEK